MVESLPLILIDKVLRDAGFDLVTTAADSWVYGRTSGAPGRIALRATDGHVAVALPAPGLASRLGLPLSAAPPPEGHAEVATCPSIEAALVALRAARSVMAHPATEMTARVEARLAAVPATERTAEVRRRIGQDVFRDALFELWEGRCAISQVALPATLLRASHAKPWAVASDHERLDPFNGLLLAVHFDALFDCGMLVVDDDGSVHCSPELDTQTRAVLALRDGLKIARVLPGHLPYLRFQRARARWYPRETS